MPDLVVHNTRYPIKGILFDKDGTLLDFVRLWGSWSENVHYQYSNRMPGVIDPLSDLWGTYHDEEGRLIDYSIDGALAMGSIDDLIAILAWQGYRLGLSWGEAKRLAWESKEAADAEMERVRPADPLPGVVSFVKQCSQLGLSLGIVTADETSEAEKHLDWMGIRPFFKTVIGNDLVKRGKPYPDMTIMACQELGLLPSEVAVIGDTNGDMQMGNSAGAAVTIGLSISGHEVGAVRLKDANVIISSFEQLRFEAKAVMI